jgi:hypothetical protein
MKNFMWFLTGALLAGLLVFSCDAQAAEVGFGGSSHAGHSWSRDNQVAPKGGDQGGSLWLTYEMDREKDKTLDFTYGMRLTALKFDVRDNNEGRKKYDDKRRGSITTEYEVIPEATVGAYVRIYKGLYAHSAIGIGPSIATDSYAVGFSYKYGVGYMFTDKFSVEFSDTHHITTIQV